jgi:hypothetical protein
MLRDWRRGAMLRRRVPAATDTGRCSMPRGIVRLVFGLHAGSRRVARPRARARWCVTLALGLIASQSARAQPPSTAATRALSGRIVRADAAQQAVANALVTIGDAGLVTRSDSLGRFAFEAVPLGPQRLSVRAIGFAVADERIEVRADGANMLEIRLSAIPELATVEVSATARRGSMNLPDFEERRRMGLGRFLTADELEAQRGRALSTILARRMPGLRPIGYAPGRTAMASGRGDTSLRGKPRGDGIDMARGAPAACYVQVSVNNVLRYRGDVGEQLYDIDLIDPATIEGIEFYTVSQLPAEFNRASNANCGALVIWLKP